MCLISVANDQMLCNMELNQMWSWRAGVCKCDSTILVSKLGMCRKHQTVPTNSVETKIWLVDARQNMK